MKIGRKRREVVIGARKSEKTLKNEKRHKKNGQKNSQRNAKEDMKKFM